MVLQLQGIVCVIYIYAQLILPTWPMGCNLIQTLEALLCRQSTRKQTLSPYPVPYMLNTAGVCMIAMYTDFKVPTTTIEIRVSCILHPAACSLLLVSRYICLLLVSRHVYM